MSRTTEAPGLFVRLARTVRALLCLAGCAAIGVASLGFTNVPWRIMEALAHGGYAVTQAPDWIVVLGGGGIPSESGLIRCYYGAQLALEYEEARVLVCLPADGDPESGSVGKMKRELVMRGVPEHRIGMESQGRSTREQALRVADLLGEGFAEQSVLLVTSDEHVKRAVLSFRKAGFHRVAGSASHAVSAEADMVVPDGGLGGRGGALAAAVQRSLAARYQYWDRMGYLVRCAREGTALAYYWMRGWI